MTGEKEMKSKLDDKNPLRAYNETNNNNKNSYLKVIIYSSNKIMSNEFNKYDQVQA